MIGFFKGQSEQGLVHHWTLTDPMGTGFVVRDRVAGVTAETVNTESSDLFGIGINLDGSNEYVRMAGLGFTLPTGDFTVSIRTRMLQNLTGTFIKVLDGSGNTVISMFPDFTKFDAVVEGTTLAGTTTVSGIVYYHFGLTRIGSAIQSYVNGSAETSGTQGATLDFSTCTLFCGVNPATGCGSVLNNYLQGVLTDIRWYDVGKSAAEMAGIATLGLP